MRSRPRSLKSALTTCRIFSASLCASSRWRNLKMVDSSSRRPNSSNWANSPNKGGVKERLLHGGVGQREPLLQEVGAQHGHQRKRRPAFEAFWLAGGNEFDQRSPWHHLVHLLQEHLIAGFLDAQIAIQAGLFHAGYFLRLVLHKYTIRGVVQGFPKIENSWSVSCTSWEKLRGLRARAR